MKRFGFFTRGAKEYGEPCGVCGNNLRYVQQDRKCVHCSNERNAKYGALDTHNRKIKRCIANGESW